MLKGPDISKWQGQIDFNALKDAIDFIIIRSSYGTGYKDEKFEFNRDEARRCGIPRGWYHYSYPQYNTPEAEADWFMNVVGTPQEGEILFLDFEENFATPVDWSLRFLNHISAKHSGYKPLLYINLALMNSQNWKPVVDAGYGLWLARWDYNPLAEAPSTQWPVVAFRQWANNQTFPGVSGNVDANVFYGDKNAFFAYGYHPVTVPPVDHDAENARELLTAFKNEKGFGNLEGTVRALIGAYNDLEKIKEEFRIYKEGEAERIKVATDGAILKNNTDWQTKLDIANTKISQLESGLAENMDWRTLFSIAWKKWWAAKKK